MSPWGAGAAPRTAVCDFLVMRVHAMSSVGLVLWEQCPSSAAELQLVR